MATINFLYRGKKETGSLTIRIKHSTVIDYRLSTNIASKRKYWFKTNKKHRKLSDLSSLGADAKLHLQYLEKVKEDLLLRFNNDYNNGLPISKEWLSKNVSEVTSILSDKEDIKNAQEKENAIKERQLQEERELYHKNLVTTAIQRVIDVEYFDNKDQIRIYNQLLNKINDYQKIKKVQLKIKQVTQNFVDEFTAFLIRDLKHQISTARKHCKSLIHAVKYQKRAFPDEVELSYGVKDVTYKKQSKSEIRKRRDEIVITLSFDELDQIHNTDVPQHLIDAKKNILFGCETGLRVSDFNKLTQENIKKEGDLEYWSFWNKKTGIDVVIPITNRIEKYINVYGMPRTEYKKSSDVIINKEIKEVCKLAGINQMVQSRKSQVITVRGKETRRTVSKEYPKYQVITNHSLRRSFATNYYKIIDTSLIRQITGHVSDSQLMEYINQSKDKTELIGQMLDKMNRNEIERQKPQLKIIKNVSNE